VRRAPALLLAAAATAALAVPALAATTRSVKVGDNYFVKDGGSPTVTVKQNTRVRWNWAGDSLHNVTVKKGPVRFHSRSQTSGSYTKTLTRRGTYRIYCTIHGIADQSMTLRVVR
jgi:plastocyanin